MRTTNVIVTCDIKNREHLGKILNKSLTVIWTTEQTEGRSIDPYMDTQNMDICEGCYRFSIEERKHISASGAQGYNDYTL